MKVDALDMFASEASDALMEASTVGLVSMSTIFFPTDRKITSRDNWVRPRCDREPRIVCDYEWWMSAISSCRGRKDGRTLSHDMVLSVAWLSFGRELWTAVARDACALA